MTYLSFFEKLGILFNSLVDFKIILLFMVLIIGFTVLYMIKRIDGKFYAKSVVLSLLLLFFTSLIVNEKALIDVFDNFMTLFFKNLYFPSVYVYLGMGGILLIATVITTFSNSIKKVYKVINASALILSSLLFILILNIVAVNKIDLFAIDSLYTNTQLLVALEVSMGLFLTWVGVLMIAYSTNNITARLKERKDVVENIITANIPEINPLNNMEPVYIKPEIDAYNSEKPVIMSQEINYEDVELPKLKQPEATPIFNYFNLPNSNRVYGNNENIEVFSKDNYNRKLKEV